MRTGAIALAVLAAAMTVMSAAGPAAAEFRYVPPAGDAAAPEPAARGPVPLPATAAGAGVGSADHGRPAWRVREGEMLRDVLARWGARAGVDVLFLTDRRYRLDGSAVFEGGFGEAAEALLQGLAHLPHPPEGALAWDGARLAVTHRVRTTAEGESKP